MIPVIRYILFIAFSIFQIVSIAFDIKIKIANFSFFRKRRESCSFGLYLVNDINIVNELKIISIVCVRK